ncbi:hypothetical protein [Polyangium aurulentum]|uniref:hypothetical protein n=1 Tax=Polyangium aurulentum TaxID=2567896 RepID=UPI0010AED42C|nr:hypothetical protein [Polyangium aurulentum]UQA61374.1 hypothetical protein E8A73_013220 [Polyangium aurulentum]
MIAQVTQAESYVVPTYQAPADTAWYHFLHGNVPGHQIDFIYRPEVPQGALTRQHFSHLTRLLRYIEPRRGATYAFAIGNLSRDDVQYEPGRGGVALIFGLRIHGATDHAGRQDPPFCHAAAAIDRHLDAGTLYETACTFYRKLLPDETSHVEGSGWYHTYVQKAQNADVLEPLLKVYTRDFDALPAPGPSALGFRWTVEGATPPKRVLIAYPDGAPFEAIAACAARLAGVLVESDIRWTSITNGREGEIPGGVSVRFAPMREAAAEVGDGLTLALEQVPEDPREIAEKIFGAQEVRPSQMPELRMGWQQLYGQHAAANAGAPAKQESAPAAGRTGSVRPPAEERPRPWAQAAEEIPVEVGAAGAMNGVVETNAGVEKREAPKAAAAAGRKPRSQVGVLVGVGVAIAVAGVVATVALGTGGAEEEKGNAAPQVVASGESGGVTAVPAGTVVPASTGGAVAPVGSSVPAGSSAPAGSAAPTPEVASTAVSTVKAGSGMSGGWRAPSTTTKVKRKTKK